jgi:hypothetical protein
MIENIGQIKQRAAKVVLAVLLLSSLQVVQNQNAYATASTGLDTLTIKDATGTDFTTPLEVDTTTALVASVSYETNTVTIFPGFSSPDTITISSVNFPSESTTATTVPNTDSLTATLRVGSNTFSIITFTSTGQVSNTLTITRAQPDLRISFDPAGYLSTYDSVTARYGGGNSGTFTVSSLTLIDTVTALSLSQVETITVGGSGFGSGNSWMIDELVIGEDNFFYVVTQAKVIGGESPIYETTTVTVRVPSLSDLTSTGTLSPTFNSFTKSYTVSVANTVSSITFTPTTGIGSFVDSITVAGESVTSTVASSPISLSVGANTVVIIVTATNSAGPTYDTFTVTVNRAAPADAGGGGGGGGGGSSGSSAPVLKTQGAITITSSVTTIEYGNSFKISVSGGNSSGVIKYSSTGTALCSITPDGLVTAVGKGSCVITATKDADGVYAATSTSITITVTDVTVAGVVTTIPTATTQTMSISKVVAGITTAKVKIGIDYAGDRVSVLLGTKVNGKITYKTLGSTTVGSTGYVTYKSKVKMPKGSVLRLKSGSEVIFTRTIS